MRFVLFQFQDINFLMGWSPGLVVMVGDSCSEGRGFESHQRILDFLVGLYIAIIGPT